MPSVLTTPARRFVASRWAPWALLAVVGVAHVVVTYAGADPFRMVDLDVYVQGGQHLFDGTLYEFVTQPLELPFTYPPFSALVFVPLGWLPWTLTRIIWQLASFAALAAIIYCTLRLLGRAGRGAAQPLPHVRGIVITGTALGLWLEPVRTTFNYGQINLFLGALLLAGAVAGKQWVAGATVGLAAGIKVVPAITGLYYLMQRQWRAVVAAVVAFAATGLLMLAIIPKDTWHFFTDLLFGDPGRTGPVWSVINQSLLGALSRLAGYRVSTAWVLAAALAVLLGVAAAWVALRAGDRTASLLAVEFTGLLVSPISWSHHWVWVLPLILWCLYGPHRGRPVVVALAVAWLLATCSYLVSFLIALQYKGEPASRPGWESWAGTVYPVLGVLTLAALLLLSRPAAAAARAAT